MGIENGQYTVANKQFLKTVYWKPIAGQWECSFAGRNQSSPVL